MIILRKKKRRKVIHGKVKLLKRPIVYEEWSDDFRSIVNFSQDER